MGVVDVAGTVRGFLISGILVLVCRLAVSPLQAGVRVFRCTDGAGRVELRQTYCPSGEQQRLQVETSNLGWVRPKGLDSSYRKTKKIRATGSRKTGSTKPREGSEDALQQGCWKTEKKLERVQRQLRQGYRPAQGEKLRRRRREHEQYLQRFCRR